MRLIISIRDRREQNRASIGFKKPLVKKESVLIAKPLAEFPLIIILIPRRLFLELCNKRGEKQGTEENWKLDGWIKRIL